MAVKTVNVTARIQPDIKEGAEEILEKLGIPFVVTLPKPIPTRDTLSDAEFSTIMEKGLKQAKADESVSTADAFAKLREGI